MAHLKGCMIDRTDGQPFGSYGKPYCKVCSSKTGLDGAANRNELIRPIVYVFVCVVKANRSFFASISGYASTHRIRSVPVVVHDERREVSCFLWAMMV